MQTICLKARIAFVIYPLSTVSYSVLFLDNALFRAGHAYSSFTEKVSEEACQLSKANSRSEPESNLSPATPSLISGPTVRR